MSDQPTIIQVSRINYNAHLPNMNLAIRITGAAKPVPVMFRFNGFGVQECLAWPLLVLEIDGEQRALLNNKVRTSFQSLSEGIHAARIVVHPQELKHPIRWLGMLFTAQVVNGHDMWSARCTAPVDLVQGEQF